MMMLPELVTALETRTLFYNGSRTEGRTPAGQGTFGRLFGWTISVGRDDEFDAACKRAGIPDAEIRHPDGVKPYWYFGAQPVVYPLCAGCPRANIYGATAVPAEMTRAGVGARWPKDKSSQVAVQVFPAPLVAARYLRPVVLQAKSLSSSHLLAALAAHAGVCRIAMKVLDRRVFPSEIGLPLGMGEEEMVGKPGAKSPLCPIIARHPVRPDRAYLETLLAPPEVLTATEDLWPEITAWAEAYNTPMVALDEAQPAGAPAFEGTQPEGAAASDTPRPAGRPPIRTATIEDLDGLCAALDAALTPEECEELRQRAIQLRNRRAISTRDQMEFAEIAEQRGRELLDQVPI